MDYFEGMSDQRKIEWAGYIEANRFGDQAWQDQNSFYESKCGLVSVVLDSEDDNTEEEY